MAKGNDGNLLQHTIECELARVLTDKDESSQLFLVSTHGMAPYENCPNPKEERRLKFWLEQPESDNISAPIPAVVPAYRRTEASLEKYPNSGELLAKLLGVDRIKGLIVEKNRFKRARLDERWSSTRVEILGGSWRDHFRRYETLEVDCPWLFTMDPMKYVPEPASDDSKLYPSDLQKLLPAFDRLLRSEQKGAIAIFSFGMTRFIKTLNQYEFFREEMTKYACHFGSASTRLFEVQRGNMDVGLVITNEPSVLDRVGRMWLDVLDRPDRDRPARRRKPRSVR